MSKWHQSLKKSINNNLEIELVRIRNNYPKIILIFLFVFSVFLRLWNLNSAGRTWDEYAYINSGSQLLENIRKGDFTNSEWYQIADHPPVARYFYGISSYFDRGYYVMHTRSGKSILKLEDYYYSWAVSRLVSVFFFSFTVIFVFLLGSEISLFAGTTSALIFTMLPISLGLSQLVTLESPLIFFFTGTVYFFLRLLKKITIPKILITGLFLGLAIGVKLSNLLLIALLPLIYVASHFFQEKKLRNISSRKILISFAVIYGIAIIIFIAIWPGLWLHAGDIIHFTLKDRFSFQSGRTSELFFGKYIQAPYSYYFTYFLLTTPLLILILFFIGTLRMFRSRYQFGLMLFLWFLFPFIQSFYHLAINGIRYIIEIYVPLALIAAYGLEAVANKLSKGVLVKVILLAAVFAYLLITIVNISPYYLSYFNSLVGGAKGVYEHQLFPLGWWGEGQKEAGEYVDSKGSAHDNLGLALIPEYVFPFIHYKSMKYFQDKQALLKALSEDKFDYIFINDLFRERTRFDEKLMYKDYRLVYSVMANGAPIVKVFKRK